MGPLLLLTCSASLPASSNRFYIGRLSRPFELHRPGAISRNPGAFMTDSSSSAFSARGSTADIEQGATFQPKLMPTA